MPNQNSKNFPIFEWAQKKQNPPTSTSSQPPVLAPRQVFRSLNPTSSAWLNQSESSTLDDRKDITHPQNASISEAQAEKNTSSEKTSSQRTNFKEHSEAQENLISAYNAYNSKALLPNGLKPTIRNCAKFYTVSTSTLGTQTSGKRSAISPRPPGRPSVFSQTELKEIVNHLLVMADLGFGYSELQAMNLIMYLADVMRKDVPGFKVTHGFMAYLFIKFPELTKRKALALDYQRATCLTKEIIDEFFVVLGEAYRMCRELSGEAIHPRDIWSMDEVGFSLSDGGGYRVIARKGTRRVNVLVPTDRQHITVVFYTNAQGFCLEPCFILKSSTQVTSFREHCKTAGFFDTLVML